MHNSTSWVTWYENSQAFILRQVGPKACTPRAPKHSRCNQRDTHYTHCSHGGRDRGGIFVHNCLLGAKDAPGKETGMSLPFPCPQDNMEWDKKTQRERSLEGDLISFKRTWLCFFWNKRAHYWGWVSQMAAMSSQNESALMWSNSFRQHTAECQLFSTLTLSYNYTLKASVYLNDLRSKQLGSVYSA